MEGGRANSGDHIGETQVYGNYVLNIDIKNRRKSHDFFARGDNGEPTFLTPF